ncbi:MAG: hypothetical protein KDE03_15960 [Rhodobacteraceae bacterium]|nr:hypothetical protein [Paracoccaceae bacterium]
MFGKLQLRSSPSSIFREDWLAPFWVALAYLALFPALSILPHVFMPATDAVSQAVEAGYSNRIAYLVAVLWMGAVLVGAFGFARGGAVAAATTAALPVRPRGKTGLVLPALIVLTILVLFFPPAQALTGPRLEESIHLNAIHRMRSGDVPYRDFEFLYGPLMLYPAYWWTNVFGWSLDAYYSYIAMLELLVMLALSVPVLRHFRNLATRLAIYLLLSGFYFNALLGPNQNGLRKLAGVFLLLWLTEKPMARGRWIGAGIGIGLLLAYSQEFGAATAVGVGAVYIALAVKTRSLAPAMALGLIAAVSAISWVGTLWLLLGAGIGDYFAGVAWLARRFDLGEAAFAWYWTLSGAAVFGLIAMACLQVGRILSRRWDDQPGWSDLFFVAAVAYAALMLKSGLNRADQWHLVPVVLPIVFAFLLPLGAKFAPLPRRQKVLGLVLTAVLALAYSFGQWPIARYVFRERLVEGYAMLADGTAQAVTLPGTAYRPMVLDTGSPSPDLVDVARFLALPEWRGRAVFVYARNWTLPYQTGVRRAGYLADDYIYGDERGEDARAQLERDPSILIVIRPDEWDWITGDPAAAAPVLPFNLGGWGIWRTLRAYVSSVHIPAVPVEEELKTLRWRHLLGDWIAPRYEPAYRSERYIILQRKPE